DGDGIEDAVEVLLGLDPRDREDAPPGAPSPPGDPSPPDDPAPPPPTTAPPPPPPPGDNSAPATSITSGPTGTMATAAASFGFTSSEAGSRFHCRLDGGVWNPCNSPKTV